MKRNVVILFGVIFLNLALWGCQKERKAAIDFSRPVEGLSKKLAIYRSNTISNVQYRLSFHIPDSTDKNITGTEFIHFNLNNISEPLIMDFSNAGKLIKLIRMNGSEVKYKVFNGHVILPADRLQKGDNYIYVSFISGNEALNRNTSYMYSLFVPALAHTAFPCFDQPDLKAGFQLKLTLPKGWTAITNAPLFQKVIKGERVEMQYGDTPPLSTYQFAFAAGKFKTLTGYRNGREMTMYYREPDNKIVDRNSKDIFDLADNALNWLQNYTGIPFPYEKYDFFAVPSFQFGGMEHPGAIYFKASGLFLRPSSTLNDSLGRATLISHETSHMWFGDMVTMKWFNDVWTKEVFAQFMADKMVQDLYPKINFDQRFLLAHYPSAYSKDRSEGAEAIRQPLHNMLNASDMYIMAYDKAPIVMRQLEQIIGPKKFQKGLQEYLHTYRFSNATWLNLITTLNKYTGKNLTQWNKVWVEAPGRPTIEAKPVLNPDGTLKSISLIQTDPSGEHKIWPQQLNVLVYYNGQSEYLPVYLNKSQMVINKIKNHQKPDFILPDGKGIAYGYFKLDKNSRTYLMSHLPDISDPTTRSIAWVTLWDNFLEGTIPADNMFKLEMSALPHENNELNIKLILGYLDQTFWQYLDPSKRKTVAPDLEQMLWTQMESAKSSSIKSTYFSSYRSLVTTSKGLERLYKVWNKKIKIHGLTFSQRDFNAMAVHLALNEYPGWKNILDKQQSRLIDPDRIAEFKFVRPALSDKQEVRDTFFNSLRNINNRHHEPWVIEGLNYLNYPSRARESIKYILPSLKLLKEIQETGDIFFPGRWVNAALSGHRSKKAADIVRDFLKDRPNYPHFLKDKILQAADPLFRASSVVKR